MKRALMLCLILLVCSAPVWAQANVTFAWDYGTPMPSGFEMRFAATAGGTPTFIFDCGPSLSKSCAVLAIPAGSWFGHCRAYNVGVPVSLKSYSDASNEVSLTVPPKPAGPTNNRVTGAQVAMLIDVPDDSIAKIALSFDKKPVP